MAKVFISYKREEQELAQFVRTKFAELGIEYFMDDELSPDENYSLGLDRQLAEAGAVLVLWTNLSVRSEFVYSEAQKGNRRRVLVAARFNQLSFDDLPVPFNAFQTSDLSDWRATGAAGQHPQWQNVLDALGRKLGRPALPALAAALDDPNEEPKQAFLRAFPDDVATPRLAEELAERNTFRESLQKVQRSVERWKRNIEKRILLSTNELETSISNLRQGKKFVRPNLVKALDHDVEALREKVQDYEKALREKVQDYEKNRTAFEERVEQAEKAAAAATERRAALEKEIGDLHVQYQTSQREAQALTEKHAAATERMATLDKEIGDLHVKHEIIRGEAQEFARKYEDAAGDAEIKSRQLERLQIEHAALNNAIPLITRKYGRMGAVAAVGALLFGFGIGAVVFLSGTDGGSGLATARAQLAEMKSADAKSRSRQEEFQRQVDALKGQLDQKQEQIAALQKRIATAPGTTAQQGGPLIPAQERIKDLEALIGRKDGELKNSNTRIEQLQKDATDKERSLQARLEENRLQFASAQTSITALEGQLKKQQDGIRTASIASKPLPFKLFPNTDMAGIPYLTKKEVTRDWCVSACQANDQCLAYTFDKWNGHCSLKSSVGLLHVEAKGDTGVRNQSLVVHNAELPVRFCAYNGYAFQDETRQTYENSSTDSCRKLCNGDKSCIAFTFVGSSNTCRILGTTTKPVRDSAATSGVKAQKPSDQWCPS